jgi:hypothetical protein
MPSQAVLLKRAFIMATLNSGFPTPRDPITHGGLERVLTLATEVKQLFSEMLSTKRLPTYILGLTIMAAVTFTERALDRMNTGFAVEWITLSLVALLTFVLCANAVRYATRSVLRWTSSAMVKWRAARADERLWDYAMRDPRVMNEILRAEGREADFVDEPRVHIHAPRSAVEPAHVPQAPMFSRYY